MKKSFNTQEIWHHKCKRHGTKPMHPSSSSRAFQRHQEHNLKHPSSMDLISTKQSKLPSFSFMDGSPHPPKSFQNWKASWFEESGKKCNSFTLSTDRLVSSMHITDTTNTPQFQTLTYLYVYLFPTSFTDWSI